MTKPTIIYTFLKQNTILIKFWRGDRDGLRCTPGERVGNLKVLTRVRIPPSPLFALKPLKKNFYMHTKKFS